MEKFPDTLAAVQSLPSTSTPESEARLAAIQAAALALKAELSNDANKLSVWVTIG